MITQAEFKRQVLIPLMQGEKPSVDVPITLLAVEVEQPLDYVFEGKSWDEVSGAAKQLARASEKMKAVINAEGYSSDDLLHSSGGSLLAVCHDESVAKRWSEAIERAVAAETDVVTVSTAVRTFSSQEIVNGLYRAPRSVIGVPGMHDYQARINKYYGVESQSTVPKEDAVASRRHFGEVVALMGTLLAQAREGREVYPFYEALPFVERCGSCGVRPAETLTDAGTICGVCQNKRKSAEPGNVEQVGIVRLQAIGLERVLEGQRTAAAYRKVCRELTETLSTAGKRTHVTLFAQGLGWLAVFVSVHEALDFAAGAIESVAQHYGMKLPTSFVAAVALAKAPGQWRVANELAAQMIDHLRRSVESGTCSVDVRTFDAQRGFDRFRKPYSLDETRQLIEGVKLLKSVRLPEHFLENLSEQVAKGSAGLYYTFERSKLGADTQQVLQRIERAWDVGTSPGPRYFAMLTTAIAIAKT